MGSSPSASPFSSQQQLTTDNQAQPQETQKEPDIRPGDIAPCWYSPEPNLVRKISERARLSLKSMFDSIGNKDVAARRWEVQQSWEARLFDRGYQFLLPRRGGGWIVPPFASDYNRGTRRRGDSETAGRETNIYETYGEIITAALTRDIPEIVWEAGNPESDVDKTACEAAERYARYFAKQNDLLAEHHQLVYYLRNDGRAIAIVDHIVDAQRFGRCDPNTVEVNPETEGAEEMALAYVVRHGETDLNAQEQARGRAEVPLNRQGVKQVSGATEYLKKKGVSRIIASPVERGLESGQQMAQSLGVPLDIDDRFSSRDIGEDLEGQPSDEVGQVLRENADQPDLPLPGGGESQDELDNRVGQGLMEVLGGAGAGGGPPAISTHDSVVSSMFRMIHGGDVPPTDAVPPGGVAGIFPLDGGGYTIRPVYPSAQQPGQLPAEKGDARGAELVEFVGKLEGKVSPINAQRQSDLISVQISREYDFVLAKAMFPDFADQIKAGAAGTGENELDRIARINVCIALEASYVTGDSMVRDCTVQRTWLRPSMFMEEQDPDVREELITSFPLGCMGIVAGEAFVVARNENMDDHITVINALPGSGMNRMALCSKLLSCQKRLNNWVDLLNDYFIRTVPQVVRDTALFNMAALKDQDQTPGGNIGVTRSGVYANPTVPLSNGIFVEPAPQPQTSMPDFIKFFIADLGQLLSGAMPALFGSNSNMNSQVGSLGYGMQRDQALGRLATPWHAIQMATASYFRQAVQLAARCRKEPRIYSAGQPGDAVKIELADLRGNVLAFPFEDPDVPDSWNQRQARYEIMITQAASNPFLMQLLSQPQNAKLAVDAVRLQGFSVPAADAWDKQLGEFEVLLSGGPLPNPAKMAAAAQMQQALQMGVNPMATGLNAQQIAAMPDMVPSLAPDDDPEAEDNATEAAACFQWMNSAEGRKYKNGTPDERAAFQNVKLHWKIHAQRAQAKAAQMAQQNAPPPKPPSMNFKDLPPRAAAVELQRHGLPSSPQEVATTQAQ